MELLVTGLIRRGVACSALAAAVALSGCSTVTPITNHEPVAAGASYEPQYRSRYAHRLTDNPVAELAPACTDTGAPEQLPASAVVAPADQERLSPGDLVDIHVGEDELFSTTYKVSQDGTIRLPHMPAVRAAGLSVDDVQAAIAERLVDLGFYRAPPMVSVRVTDSASARVFVSGAVFEPGPVVIGGTDAREIDQARQKSIGWNVENRRLSRALQSAGGIRPDADLAHVAVVRGGEKTVVDVRPVLVGKPFADMVLLAGDRVEVASRGCFQPALMAPTQVTAAGIKVFMSNLTQPATSNATSAISIETQNLRYGIRLMQAMVGMNCVGGATLVNADRSVVLMTHNPITGASVVISRRVEDLVHHADRDEFNPYLLPGDAMACYDSRQTNLLAITTAFGTVLSSALLAYHL